MNVALQREIEKWVTNELKRYATENEISPVFWQVSVMSRNELLEIRGGSFEQKYFPTPDIMSEFCVHIKLFKNKTKIADKLLFLASFWEAEQPIIKEVIKFLFLVIQGDVTKIYE